MGNWEWDWWKVRRLCGELGMGLVEGEAALCLGNWEWDWWKVRRLCGELGMGLVEGEAAAWGTGNGTGGR